jgi:hypothetical protein
VRIRVNEKSVKKFANPRSFQQLADLLTSGFQKFALAASKSLSPIEFELENNNSFRKNQAK